MHVPHPGREILNTSERGEEKEGNSLDVYLCWFQGIIVGGQTRRR